MQPHVGGAALQLCGRRSEAGTAGISFAKGQYDFNWSILAVQPTSPFHGKLQTGQQLLQVDDVRVSSKTADEISALLKGDPGTEIRLYVSQHINKRSDPPLQPSAPYAFRSMPQVSRGPAAVVLTPSSPPSQPPEGALEVVGYRSAGGAVGLSFAKEQDSAEEEW